MTRDEFDQAIAENYAALVHFTKEYVAASFTYCGKDYLHQAILYYLEPNDTGIPRYKLISNSGSQNFRRYVMWKVIYLFYNQVGKEIDSKMQANLEHTLSDYDKLHFPDECGPEPDELPSPDPSPLQGILEREEHEEHEKSLDELLYFWYKLPQDLQDVLELVVADGLTQLEAASALGVSHRTVKRRWQRALRLLRSYLPDDDSN